jgi:aromatic-L-amino-acid/L-tryptophan decarboxylase
MKATAMKLDQQNYDFIPMHHVPEKSVDLASGPDTHSSAESSRLAMTSARFRSLGDRALLLAADHLDQRSRPRVRATAPAEGWRHIREMMLPAAGSDEDDILDFLAGNVMSYPLGNAHPRFFGWITSAPAPIGVLADWLATTMNANCGPGDHAVAELEGTVCRWLMELTGFPTPGSHGLLVSGGSMANLTALATARHWACARLGRDVRRQGAAALDGLVLYQSAETHACVQKAVELLGLGRDSLRTIPVDRALRMRPELLAEAVATDRAAGLRPFCVVATTGTVNSGAIDPLERIADLCEADELWLHVDGAYGGIAAADPAMRDVLAPMARAHSLALDPHKWLGVPIECGCVLMRDAAAQYAAFSVAADYLRGTEVAPAHREAWPFEFGLQLTRGPRAVKAAAVLMRLGREGVAAMVGRHRALAAWLAARIEAADDLELTAPASLSIVCFRVVPPGQATEA